MIKKIISFFILSTISINAFSMQCPPASALHHPVKGQDWILDEKYKSQGWYTGNDFEPVKQSPLTTLPVGSDITVQLRSSEYWKATCYYIVPGDLPLNENVIMLGSTQSFDERKVPQPPFIYFNDGRIWLYSCSTTSDPTSRSCAWSEEPLASIPRLSKP